MSSPRAVQTLLEYSFAIILHQPSLHPLPRPPPSLSGCVAARRSLYVSQKDSRCPSAITRTLSPSSQETWAKTGHDRGGL